MGHGLKITIKNIGDAPIESWADYHFYGKFEKLRFFIFPGKVIDEVEYIFSTSDELLPGESFDRILTDGSEAKWPLEKWVFFGVFKVTASFTCNSDSNPDNNIYLEKYYGRGFINWWWTEF